MLTLLQLALDKSDNLLSIFEKAKKFLVGDKKKAAEELQKVAEEMMKFLVITQEEISNFQGLDFSTGPGSAHARKVFYDIQSGMMGVRVVAASGSCNEIKLIYQYYLSTWFKDVFGDLSSEFMEVEKIFTDLFYYDTNIIGATSELEDYLKKKSMPLLQMLDTGDQNLMPFYHEASNELLTIRKKLSDLLSRFLVLKNEFKLLAS